MNHSICGLNCNECYCFGDYCSGCNNLQGKPPHFKESGCPLYNCCTEKDYQHCGKCADFPCQKYYDLRDPNQTDEQHQDGIKKRVKCLGNSSK